ncbi:hypothetical protein LQ564_12540 [Massilia sp. G4R7]|uniref:FecR protein domain-containing protein n=1 Tax=Massilia phyllostachyos TaxID=2898585 RepID=A0ABS8Q6C2_9BURK|nr:hypothetical protein [Massilia phyllostachyos]MCD2517134.1 hypothetical protein [Massilia phyllostachyos]
MRIPLFLACLLLAAPAAAQTPAVRAPAVLTLAEQPLRLIRGTAVYRAQAGVALQKDDILETGAAGAQCEAASGAIVALGPQTRVLVQDLPTGGKGTSLAVLRGWVKLMTDGGKPGLVATPALQLSLVSGSAIVRAGEDGRDAMFAEEGAQQLAKVEKGKSGAPLKLAAEQYAEIDPAKPQPVAGRPPRAFVTAMPPSFRDRLARVPNLANAGKVAPLKERDADFADVEPWLAARLPGVKPFVARFRPRLADPVFRKQLERALGQQPEWKAALHPPVRPGPAGVLF